MPEPERPREYAVRDSLAAERTLLANERTFLAYIRTALTLFIAGVTFVKFFEHWLVEIIGWIFIPAGIYAFATGARRSRKIREEILKDGWR